MSTRIWRTLFAIGLLSAAAPLIPGLRGDEPPAAPAKPAAVESKPAAEAKPPAAADNKDDDKNIVYLDKDHNVWLDKKNKQVLMTGKIAVREGNLEMLASPQQEKEYEAIIAVTARDMSLVHAGLLALGAKPGHPAKFDQKFSPPTGTQIEVTVRWTDAGGAKHDVRGQDLVRNLKTGKSLEYPWVFAGSLFRVDVDTGEKKYMANEGDFICVVNFGDSMLDLAFESPKDWSEHVFEPFTERIPPKDTDVILVLTPKPEKEDSPKKSGE